MHHNPMTLPITAMTIAIHVVGKTIIQHRMVTFLSETALLEHTATNRQGFPTGEPKFTDVIYHESKEYGLTVPVRSSAGNGNDIDVTLADLRMIINHQGADTICIVSRETKGDHGNRIITQHIGTALAIHQELLPVDVAGAWVYSKTDGLEWIGKGATRE